MNERSLEAEQRRLERYKIKRKSLEREGYTKTDLTISAGRREYRALYGLIMTVPLLASTFLDMMVRICKISNFSQLQIG